MADASAADARPSTSIDWWTGGPFAVGSICFAVGKSLLGWLVALVYNAVADLGSALGEEYSGSHVRILRRMFFNRPGTL